MATNKNMITMENLIEWFTSTGFLFPTNERELERFEKLYPKLDDETMDYNISIERILAGKSRTIITRPVLDSEDIANIRQYRMVARFGENKDLPTSIMDKIKKNEAKNNNDASNKKEEN